MRPKAPFDPNNLRSILSHGKRRGRKKTVSWVEDSNIKEVFYFEMDDTERGNFLNNTFLYLCLFLRGEEWDVVNKSCNCQLYIFHNI